MAFSIETFSQARRLVLDPNNWVLKNSGDLRVRGHPSARNLQRKNLSMLTELNKALDVNKNSSLAHYRILISFLSTQLPVRPNGYFEALTVKRTRWTEVWSPHAEPKIFDTGQRNALLTNIASHWTGDRARSDEARKCLENS